MTDGPHISLSGTKYPASDAGLLVLGTAQLGMTYGIANRTGQPNFDHALEMIRQAWSLGLRFFDTAQAYGESEAVLGRILSLLGIQGGAMVFSKLGAAGQYGTAGVGPAIETSLRRLGVRQLAGLLMHSENDLDSDLPAKLTEARRAGLIRSAGASVYSCERALQALSMEGMDILQVSANVFDRRMFRAEVFSRAAAMGKTVFIRSIYLQGLITQEPSAVAPGISGAKEAVRTYRDFCARHGLEPRRFAFDHVRRMAPQAKLVVGAETVEQIRQNMEICYAAPYDAELHSAWTHLWPKDHAGLIDPRQWNTAQRQDIRQ